MHWTREIRADAHKATHRAVKYGLLPSPKGQMCVDCGEPAILYDHRDYFKALDVDAVCKGCNNRRGPGLPPPMGEDPNVPRRPSINRPTKKKNNSEKGADVRNRTEDVQTKVLMPQHRKNAYFEMNRSKYKHSPLAHGDLRAEYFKQHDPYYQPEMFQ